MKTNKIQSFLVLATLCGLLLVGCKKETNTTSTSTTSQQVGQVQNSDIQDAVADKTEQDVDNTADEVQNSDYQNQTSTAKSALSSSRTITVNHPDSTTFPKVITIVYNNWSDSTAEETFIKNGEIDITVSIADSKHPRLVTRSFTFKNFSVTTDSTTVSLTGTRTVQRMKDSLAIYHNLGKVRLAVTDNITANLRFAIAKTGSTDSMTFTRIVSKTRVASSWYKAYLLDMHLRVMHLASGDTITFTGEVTGVNEKGEPYDKKITTPLQVNVFRGTPVISAGEIDFTGGTGSNAFSYTITFKQDLPNHPHKTLITVTNTVTGKTFSFDRRLGGWFIKWW